MNRLWGIQSYIDKHPISFLSNLQKELYSEYLTVIRQEELSWKLKSRVNWLDDGDQNTKYFHQATLHCRRNNKIHGLKINNNRWVFYDHHIISHILNHFQMVYTFEHCLSYNKQCLNSIPHPVIPIEKLYQISRKPNLS